MHPVATLRTALRALLRNKMRSSLTALGVVIGVGAVIAMVAIGEGAKRRVQQTFESMGTNMLMVLSGSSGGGGMRGGFGSQPTLTWDDLAAIRTQVPTVKWAAPMLRSQAVVQSEDQNWTTQVIGTTPEYLSIRNWEVVKGEAFGPGTGEGTKVVLLGKTVIEKLWGSGVDPVGQSVRINKVPFTVIGVLAEKGQSMFGQDNDDVAIVPVSTYMSKIQGGLSGYVNGVLWVSATGSDLTARAELQIEDLLRDRHHIRPGEDDDFSVRNFSEMAQAQTQGTQVLTALLASIAAVSLLVGGIGIMNIMLVSVTERTREIGIRMAVGARPRDILGQFVTEALALSLLGGVIGMGVGLLVAKQLSLQFRWPMVVQPGVIALAMGFSALVGLVFGLYPARKASRLDPIEALRFE